MPEGQIKYTDVFSPDYQAGIDRANQLLQEQIKYLEKLRESFSSARPESLGKHNEELKDTVVNAFVDL